LFLSSQILNLESPSWVKGKLTLYITNSFVSVRASILDSVSANVLDSNLDTDLDIDFDNIFDS
ncbi:5734_t:CDS:1, partial [Diversispora eburnea]